MGEGFWFNDLIYQFDLFGEKRWAGSVPSPSWRRWPNGRRNKVWAETGVSDSAGKAGMRSRSSACRSRFIRHKSYSIRSWSQKRGSCWKKSPSRSAVSGVIGQRPWINSLMRLGATSRFLASLWTDSLKGRKNSSCKISPGWISSSNSMVSSNDNPQSQHHGLHLGTIENRCTTAGWSEGDGFQIIYSHFTSPSGRR